MSKISDQDNISTNSSVSQTYVFNKKEKIHPMERENEERESNLGNTLMINSPFLNHGEKISKIFNEERLISEKNKYEDGKKIPHYKNKEDSELERAYQEKNAPILKKMMEELDKKEDEIKIKKVSEIVNERICHKPSEKTYLKNNYDKIIIENPSQNSIMFENDSEDEDEEEEQLIVGRNLTENMQNSNLNICTDNKFLKQFNVKGDIYKNLPSQNLNLNPPMAKDSIPDFELRKIFSENELSGFIEFLATLEKEEMILRTNNSNVNLNSSFYNEYKEVKKLLEKYDREFLISLIFFFYENKNQRYFQNIQGQDLNESAQEAFEEIQIGIQESSNAVVPQLKNFSDAVALENLNKQEKIKIVEERRILRMDAPLVLKMNSNIKPINQEELIRKQNSVDANYNPFTDAKKKDLRLSSLNINCQPEVKCKAKPSQTNKDCKKLKRKIEELQSTLLKYNKNILDAQSPIENGQSPIGSPSSQLTYSCQDVDLETKTRETKECINNIKIDSYYNKLKDLIGLSKALAIKNCFENDTELKLRLFSTEMFNVLFKKTKLQNNNGESLIRSQFKIYKRRKYYV
jgi:hypothetical protein